MKIGVITWFKYENFGTALQAVALQTYLKSKGFDVELIDFKIPTPKNSRPSTKKELYDTVGRLIEKADSVLYKKYRKEKSAKFKKFIKNNCKISRYVEIEKEYIDLCNLYDYLIFGSDQIWNPNWYHPFYFANYGDIKTGRISYAPSFGVSKIDGEDSKEIKNALEKFKKISVREKAGVSIVEEMLNKTPELVVDPTLLLGQDNWSKFENKTPKKKKYILCYMLTDNRKHWKAIKNFARRKELEVIILPHNGHSLVQSKNVVRNAGPAEFLSLIKNAEYIITDSYHAIIFSLIYNKNVVLFERHNPALPGAENSRIYSFLEILNIREKLLPFGTGLIKDSDVTYLNNVKELDGLIEKSKKYLEEELK